MSHGGEVIYGGGVICSWRPRSDGLRAPIIRGGGLPGEGVMFEHIGPRLWSL
ncbi:hypothetical protein N9L68_03120 [bacterium]|nr:hypothetical protein [bacterium]